MRKKLVVLLVISILSVTGIQQASITLQKAAIVRKEQMPINTEEIPINEEEALKQPYIPIIVKALESGIWNPALEGMANAAEDYGIQITFEGTQRGAEVQEQLDIIETALARNPQAIILSALDSSAVRPYLESAQAAGIPVIGLDSGVDSPIVRTTVATDNYEAAVLAAEKMAELIGGEGKVGLIVLDRTSKVGIDRADGFTDTMRINYPNIEVLPVQYGEGSLEMSKEAAMNMLLENPDLKGIFGANEDSSIGIAEAVRELNREDEITIVGFDAGRVAQAIREGIITGAIAQNPREMGYRVVEAANWAYQGLRLPEFINTGFIWYDRNNIDTPEVQEIIYE
ncbi:ABC transporter substrate-binding protein [Cellulosilyticum sp. I15G10I2]|uniref:ABC transporter substrate-binding protein n=1 Tax=Cellulosilyticum sp. I15G10I2 TaxID=1892843 RepID=UPI0009F615D9|nr:ABC transporter substrate-binding protein [Cellulosilyticum sp. I15G10I2]